MRKNDDTDKYKYQGHGIASDLSGIFNHPDGGDGENVIIFGVDMTNSKHANNTTKGILVLGHVLIQKVGDTTIYAEKMYSSDFTVANKTFRLNLHYNGDDSYLFVNGKEVIKFKAKKQSVIEKLSMGKTSQLILIRQSENQQGFMDIFMILVLTVMLFQMIKYMIFMLI